LFCTSSLMCAGPWRDCIFAAFLGHPRVARSSTICAIPLFGA
jgi:hypothetical protein